MRSAADEPGILSWTGDGFRLIPSRFPPVDVYENIVSSDRVESLVAVENLTNPRLQAAQRLTQHYTNLQPDSPRLQNWNHAPFAYSNPEGSRFFSPERPCLELADCRQTALAISVARREKFLFRTKEPPTGLDMRMLKTPTSGRFMDLRHLSLDLSRQDRWKLGADLPASVQGILFRPPERPSATCLAVLDNSALGRSVQTEHYRYVWGGAEITKLYAFDNEGLELFPDALAGTHDVFTGIASRE